MPKPDSSSLPQTQITPEWVLEKRSHRRYATASTNYASLPRLTKASMVGWARCFAENACTAANCAGGRREA
jgi:hypothetical protein